MTDNNRPENEDWTWERPEGGEPVYGDPDPPGYEDAGAWAERPGHDVPPASPPEGPRGEGFSQDEPPGPPAEQPEEWRGEPPSYYTPDDPPGYEAGYPPESGWGPPPGPPPQPGWEPGPQPYGNGPAGAQGHDPGAYGDPAAPAQWQAPPPTPPRKGLMTGSMVVAALSFVFLCCCWPISLFGGAATTVMGYLHREEMRRAELPTSGGNVMIGIGVLLVVLSILMFVANLVIYLIDPTLSERMLQDLLGGS